MDSRNGVEKTRERKTNQCGPSQQPMGTPLAVVAEPLDSKTMGALKNLEQYEAAAY